MKKFITIAFVIGSFILSTGCSEQSEDTRSTTTLSSHFSAVQQATQTAPTETETQTTTESEMQQTAPETTTSAQTTTQASAKPAPETTTTPAPAAKPLTASASTCGGKVNMTATADPANSTITVIVDNSLNTDVRMFGFPSVIGADGFSNPLDSRANSGSYLAATAPGAKSKVVYYVDSSLLQPGVKLTGSLHCMGFFGDTSYTLTFK